MIKPTLNPSGFYRRLPLQPHQLHDRRTRTEDTIVLCHLGVPHIRPDDWSVAIDGLVDRPLRLTLSDLKQRPRTEVETIHQCAGFPLRPDIPTRRICNVVWTGVRLADVLADCGPTSSARFIWSYGADYGAFESVAVEAYVKDLPLDRVRDDVLIAYELNGAPLRPEHGYPARLVIPGFYGTNSVKWLTRISLSDRRADSPFTTVWYNDPTPSGASKPVWAIAPESVIVSPAPGQTIKSGQPVDIWGWAWGDGGVASLDVSTDGGATWTAAKLEPISGRSWQRFALPWVPARSGAHDICARAGNSAGQSQPMSGARNAVHKVKVEVG